MQLPFTNSSAEAGNMLISTIVFTAIVGTVAATWASHSSNHHAMMVSKKMRTDARSIALELQRSLDCKETLAQAGIVVPAFGAGICPGSAAAPPPWTGVTSGTGYFVPLSASGELALGTQGLDPNPPHAPMPYVTVGNYLVFMSCSGADQSLDAWATLMSSTTGTFKIDPLTKQPSGFFTKQSLILGTKIKLCTNFFAAAPPPVQCPSGSYAVGWNRTTQLPMCQPLPTQDCGMSGGPLQANAITNFTANGGGGVSMVACQSQGYGGSFERRYDSSAGIAWNSGTCSIGNPFAGNQCQCPAGFTPYGSAMMVAPCIRQGAARSLNPANWNYVSAAQWAHWPGPVRTLFRQSVERDTCTSVRFAATSNPLTVADYNSVMRIPGVNAYTPTNGGFVGSVEYYCYKP